MELIKEILRELTSLPHRGSTTEMEKTAASIINRRLKEFGYSTHFDSFDSPATYSWEVILFASMVALGLLVAPREPHLGGILCVLALWSFVRHFDGKDTLLGKLIPKRTSQNVVGEMKNSQKEKVVYLMAHYDTTRASHLFHPALVKNFRKSFLVSTALIFIAPIVAFLGEWLGESAWYRTLTALLALYIFSQIIILLHREFFHNHVNGANDNGSGITAILALTKQFAENPLTNSELRVVATGCEEAGLYGARHFAERYSSGLNSQHTYVLNFDNVGASDLYYCIGEGMLGFHHYDHELVSMAERIASEKFPDVQPLRYTRAQSDALILVHHNIKTISFIALDKNHLIPNWHWYSDTIDNIDWSSIERAVEFGTAMVEAIDRGE